MNPTMTRLAKLAGVSQSTVSKAFSDSSEISEKTRQHIFEVAKEHGLFDKYNKNKFAKKVIAVICPEINSDYYNTFTSILDLEITKNGGIMAISVSNFEAEREKELFSYYVSYCGVDGIILIHPHADIQNPFRIPAVALSPQKKSENIETLNLDFTSAIENAVLYLKEMGHTQIGFAGEALTKGKMERFQNALRKAGLPVEDKWTKVSHQRFEEAGVEIAKAWLAEGTLPTAILAAYDYIAIGIMKELKEHGIRIPEDVSVIGMDDIAVAPYLETSLSSIRTYTVEACQKAVELIMKKTENQYYNSYQNITIAAEFIPRNSSGKAKNTKD